MNDSITTKVWGNRSINWVSIDAMGTISGILLLWDSRSVRASDKGKREFPVLVLLEDLLNNSKWLVTSVYGPRSSQSRMDFWKELEDINSPWCVGGRLEYYLIPKWKVKWRKNLVKYEIFLGLEQFQFRHWFAPWWSFLYLVQSSNTGFNVKAG